MKRTGKTDSEGGTDGVDIAGDGGLIKTIITAGSGDEIPDKKRAIVHYTGKLLDGTIFDSSRSRNKPFTFTVGARQVILGWDKGVKTMKKGEVALLRCRSDYAYGSGGAGPIPPGATLLFEVELLGWEEPGPSASSNIIIIVVIVALYIAFRMFISKK
jgi:FK506-binding protein 4/5